jgi:hypothetical protein
MPNLNQKIEDAVAVQETFFKLCDLFQETKTPKYIALVAMAELISAIMDEQKEFINGNKENIYN